MSNYENNQDKSEIAINQLSDKTRASIWLILAVTVFVCAVVVCLLLIANSANTDNPMAQIETHIEDIKYVANPTEPSNVLQDSDGTQFEMKAPVSIYDSERLNILLVGVDHETEFTDTVMLISIDMDKGVPSMLSIPRDTYIAGDYDMPKVNRVYDSNGERGLEALKESVENMVGFRIDKYFMFDEVVLADVMELCGAVEFDVPEEPNYHTLMPGEQKLSGTDAFGLFRYNEDYSDVETEPYKVQRDFLAKILDSFLANEDDFADNAEAICKAATTDLTASELAYLANLLKDTRFAVAFSRALPGGEITINGVDFYQVDPAQAAEMLNNHFNPLDSDLTEYDVQFRQKQGSSGEGEMPDWGFGAPHSTGTVTTDPTEEETETEEVTEEITENETPTEQEDPLEPIEPVEPGGDE